MVLTVGDHQRGSALDAVFPAQIHIFLCDQLLVSDASLVQQVLCHAAVGAGDAGEEHDLTGDGCGSSFFLHRSFHRLDCALQHRSADVIDLAVLEFLALAVVPVLDGAVVAGDAAVDLGLLPQMGQVYSSPVM